MILPDARETNHVWAGSRQTLEDRIDLVAIEAEQPRPGVGLAIAVSLIVHTLLIVYVVRNYRAITALSPASAPIVHYVELMRQPPKTFVEAPGSKKQNAPVNAPFSDANRKASMPNPTGTNPTTRPGEGPLYVPPMPARGDSRQPQQAQPAIDQPAQQPGQQATPQNPTSASGLTYRKSTAQAATSGVDWRNAIKDVGKVASLGGQQGLDLSGAGGGEKGFAASGPLSFETQWYDWGPYAASMVSRIRVNWYANMPPLIRTGMKGVVTIRFAIHRDGSITDVTIVNSSTIPPYDFAAKHAIELSSPLNPLPKDFPNEMEHVTCMFFYNEEPPARG
jgi:TonB family protein